MPNLFPVSIYYQDGVNIQEGQFYLNAILLTRIDITTNPTKTAYKAGERISYAGMVVTATYSDATTANITNLCTITPAEGKTFAPDTDTFVNISYAEGQLEYAVTLNLTNIYLSNIAITTQPTNTKYKYRQAIYYSGIVVTATYSDGSTEDITSNSVFSIAEGKTFDPETDTYVNITYNECSTTLQLIYIYALRIAVTSQPNKTVYKPLETIELRGHEITAYYSDNSTVDITGLCNYSIISGQEFNPKTDTQCDILWYDEAGETFTTYLTLTPKEAEELSLNPEDSSEVFALWDDGTTSEISRFCDYTYEENRVIIRYGNKYIIGELTIESTNPLSVIMEYSDGSEFNVTEDCQVTYDNDEIIIEYEDLVLRERLVASNLIIATPPTKTSYIANEEIDYTGIVVKYVHSDGSEHDVTQYCDFDPVQGTTITQPIYAQISCAPPLETYVYDQNSGYIDSGVWKVENPTRTYIDIYQVQAGHTYWLTLGATVGSRFRVMFTTTDISQTSSNVTGTSIINTNNPATYASVTYTPSSNGYIAVAKDNVGVSGLFTYLFDTTTTNKTESVTLPLIVATLSSINITTMPTKMSFREGAAIDYSGIVVTAIYSDGSIKEIPYADLVFFPSAGTAFNYSSPVVTVSYELGGITASTTFELGLVTLTGITVGTLTQSEYGIGEKLFFLGTPVTANYSDSSTDDVTYDSGVVFSPANDTVVTENTNTIVTVTYTNAANENASATATITITPSTLVGLTVTPPIKATYNLGDTIDYAGLIVYADYSNGAHIDVTTEATMSPADGTTWNNENILMTASYGGFVAALNTPQIESIQQLNYAEIHDEKYSYYSSDISYYEDDAYIGSSKYPYPTLLINKQSERRWIKGSGYEMVLYKKNQYDNWVIDKWIGAHSLQAIDADLNLGDRDKWRAGWGYSSYYNYADYGRAKSIGDGEQRRGTRYENYSLHTYSGDIDIVKISDSGELTISKLVNGLTIKRTGSFNTEGFYNITWSEFNSIHHENGPSLHNGNVLKNKYGEYRDNYYPDDFDWSDYYLSSYNLDTPYSAFSSYRNPIYLDVDSNKKYDFENLGRSDFEAKYNIIRVSFGQDNSLGYKIIHDETNGWQKKLRIVDITSAGMNVLKNGGLVGTWGKTLTKNYQGLDAARDILAVVAYYKGDSTLALGVFKVFLREPLIRLQRLSEIYVATNPTKTVYSENEVLDTTGLIVKARYTDGSEADITSLVSISPSNGTILTENTVVNISYTEQGITQQTQFSVIIGKVQSIEVTFLPAYDEMINCNRPGLRLYYTPGEDFTVTATMLDGTTVDVTDDCEYSPEGTISYSNPVWFRENVPVVVSYTAGNTVTTTLNFPNLVTLSNTYTITPPSKTEYRIGEVIDFEGSDFRSGFVWSNGEKLSDNSAIACTYISGDYIEIEGEYGEQLLQVTPNTSRITITTCANGGDYREAYFDIMVIRLQSITLKPPTKITYSIGESLDYSGIIATANYSDGSSDDVTDDVTYSVEAGTIITADTSTTITVSYTNIAGETATTSFNITI